MFTRNDTEIWTEIQPVTATNRHAYDLLIRTEIRAKWVWNIFSPNFGLNKLIVYASIGPNFGVGVCVGTCEQALKVCTHVTVQGLFTHSDAVTMTVLVTIKVYHCIDGEGLFDWQNGFCIHFARQIFRHH